MTTGSQQAARLDELGTYSFPLLVGTLVTCGYTPAAADALVRSRVRMLLETAERDRHGRDGTGLTPEEVELDVLTSAAAPTTCRPPVHAVERALDALPLDQRIATVWAIVRGTNPLGPGQPETVAAALGGVRSSVWAPPEDTRSSLDDVVLDAVAERSPPAQPDLIAGLRSEIARQRRRRRSLRTAAVAAATAALLAGAALTSTTRHHATPVDPFRIRQWVAVLDVGPSAASLYGEAGEIGRTAGVYVFTDRWACYEGFGRAADGRSGDWFVGIAAQDKATVDQLLAGAGRSPLVEAQVDQVCVQPAPQGAPTVTAP